MTTPKKKTIRIDLTHRSLDECVAILNAILAARNLLQDQGLKVYVRKKKSPSRN
jgi:hypothetical protein